jgi:hypothetical protein
MATRKSKPAAKLVVSSTTKTALTLTIPVAKPRNPIAINPLLKKSAAHADARSRSKRERQSALDVQRGVQEALNRRSKASDGN